MGDRRKCQTFAASPAEPGGLPVMLGLRDFAELDALFNYAYWRHEIGEDE
jgi:hypothetical protein